MKKKVPVDLDILDGVCVASVTVEGLVEDDRGVHPRSIFVDLDSDFMSFQYDVTGYYYSEGSQYLPCKWKRDNMGDGVNLYVFSVDEDGLNRDIVDMDRFRKYLVSELYHYVVLPVYNEWRVANGFEWGGGRYGSGDGEYVPFSLR